MSDDSGIYVLDVNEDSHICPSCDKWHHPLVPVEPDPAMLPEDSANECATETVLKGGTNHCIRPDGHKGSHLAFTYWGVGIGGDDPNVAICNCGTVTTGERFCDDCLGVGGDDE